jgi:hypothetical protein
MIELQVSEAYIAALGNAKDETEQFHANKLMAAYELAEITAAQVIAHLNRIG